MAKNKKACDACHRRKIQCDISNKPNQCNWCDHHGLSCTFERVRGRNKRSALRKLKPGSRDDIASRIARVEEALSRSSSGCESTFSPSTSAADPTNFRDQSISQEPEQSVPGRTPNVGVPSGQIHFDGYHLGHINTKDGIPVFSDYGQQWIASRTGENGSLQKLKIMNVAGSKQHSAQLTSSTFSPGLSLSDLPDQGLLEQFIDIFKKSGPSLVFPVIDLALFRKTVQTAYEPWEGNPSLDKICAAACVLAFCSVIGWYQMDKSKPPQVDYDVCALKAQLMLPYIIQDSSLTSLGTLFMLTMHEIFSGRFQSANMLHSLACRIVFLLGGHTRNNKTASANNDPHNLHARSKQHLRTLFWLCYVFDKDISLRTSGQPPSIPDDHCDLTLPDNYVNIAYNPATYAEDSYYQVSEDRASSTLPGDLRLTMLKSKVYKLLYSVEAIQKSAADLLRDIRELDNELEDWRLGIPLAFRPSLTIHSQHKFNFSSNIHMNMMHIILQLEYHHLISAIHQASSRCPVNEQGPKEIELAGALLSSIKLSIEASRSTIIFLHSAVHELADPAFWIVIFYPMSAITTLFCHILTKPLDSQAVEDLELLSSANNLISSLPTRSLSMSGMNQIPMVNEFVVELIRLAKCAIAKARIEEG